MLDTCPGTAVSTPDDIFEEMRYITVDEVYDCTHSLESDDLWMNYDSETVIHPEDSFIFKELLFQSNIYNMYWTDTQKYLNCKILNHDCMWAGHCGSKEHPTEEPRNHIKTILPVPPVIDRSAMAVNKQPVTSGRSLLLKPAIRQQQQQTQQNVQLPQHQQSVSPDSPPMSDDEECKTTSTLQMLQEVISACDIEDADSDLCEYFEEEDFLSETVEVPPTTTEKIQAKQASVVHYARDNDHSYHKDKNASMHLSNLGIETPSDSEEEIDVVSVADKHNTRGMVSSLPNKPTSIDRKQIQKTMATAITNKSQTTPTIKTILPFRKPTVEQSPAKRKAPENRGVKRSRHRTPNNSPYKRRCGYNHSSDSEAEPSEKRSLHNNMERQRRIDLRNAFEDLRLLVPQVSKKERAAKVVILREAAVYCDQLGEASEKMYKQRQQVLHEQERLRARLSHLRRYAAKYR